MESNSQQNLNQLNALEISEFLNNLVAMKNHQTTWNELLLFWRILSGHKLVFSNNKRKVKRINHLLQSYFSTKNLAIFNRTFQLLGMLYFLE